MATTASEGPLRRPRTLVCSLARMTTLVVSSSVVYDEALKDVVFLDSHLPITNRPCGFSLVETHLVTFSLNQLPSYIRGCCQVHETTGNEPVRWYTLNVDKLHQGHHHSVAHQLCLNKRASGHACFLSSTEIKVYSKVCTWGRSSHNYLRRSLHPVDRNTQQSGALSIWCCNERGKEPLSAPLIHLKDVWSP